MKNATEASVRTRQILLSNGLRVTLVTDPLTARAAALVRVAAGSHDEPREHPGLAHFLEHLLFRGGHGFPDGERLMPWVQARGGRLNASTQAHTTDYFFELPGAELGGGLARLADMLARPLLDVTAQVLEREVLEAEFVARSSDVGTLIDAALASGLAPGHPLRCFVAGNRASLAVEDEGFQRALRGFHQDFYHAGNLCLWLQGPQTLEELQALVEAHCAAWPTRSLKRRAKPPALLPFVGETLTLRLPGPPRLVLAFGLGALEAAEEQTLDLLSELLTDEAPGGLLAYLIERGLCDAASSRIAYRGPGQALLVVTFELVAAEGAATVEAAFLDWLQALREQAKEVLSARLPFVELQRLAPMEQLRLRARGLPAALAPDSLERLGAERMIRLRTEADAQGRSTSVSGFPLTLGRTPWRVVAFDRPSWRFAVPLRAGEAGEGGVYLRWRFPVAPYRSHFLALCQALRPVAGLARLEGVTLCLDTEGSDWTLALRGPTDCLSSTLLQALSVLRHPSPAVLDPGSRLQGVEQQRAAAEIPIRQLLDALPRVMAGLHSTPLDWASAQWDALTLNAHLPEPEQVPGRPATHCLLPPALPGGRHSRSWAGEGDAALLLFCPMASQQAADEAAWRMLARVLEVGFFGRMRGELNLGYALFCGFRQVAGWRGILFAVQSPQVEPNHLLRHVEDFLRDAAGELKGLSGERLRALGEGIAEPLASQMAGGSAQVQAAWKDHLAGVDALHSQRLAEAACRLSCSDLLAAHASLLAEQGGWWLLANRLGFNSELPL